MLVTEAQNNSILTQLEVLVSPCSRRGKRLRAAVEYTANGRPTPIGRRRSHKTCSLPYQQHRLSHVALLECLPNAFELLISILTRFTLQGLKMETAK